MNMAVIIDSFEQLTTRIGRLQMRRCGPIPAFTIFVVYTPTSTYEEEEVESFYNDLEKLYREDYTLYKVIIGDFSTKIGLRRTHGELHIGTHGLQSNEKGERLSEFIMTTKTIHENSQFQKPYSLRWTWESPGGEYRNEIDHIIVSKKVLPDGCRCYTKVLYGIGPLPSLRKIFFHTERKKSREVYLANFQIYHRLGTLHFASRLFSRYRHG
ncbi:hypothetical protein NECAME_07860 [Necator americanus]|uniref:Uncharacterized protein n=1 Tax=Necator americanus TaxID=51031 RepID=W2TN98_NECAM|nr:hypothetical protein NECAME_07860 [Necator americanus]ETN82606.1 hypothetical protein NECAME_07860 [Necator americanus]